MKRSELVRQLEAHGCKVLREGSRHTIYSDARGALTSAVPRHKEINYFTAKNIFRDLDVPIPKGR
jgi:mRNA interferase HicA